MFGTQPFLDKSMNGIKVIFDGAGAVISNGSATFNTINVSTLTADNLTDCNLKNCTADDPTDPQDIANKEYVDNNFVTLATEQNNISGSKTFTGTIKSNNYDTNIATNPLNIGQSNTTSEIRIGRNQTSGGKILMGTGFSETIIYGSIKLHATTIEDGSVFKSRIIESSAPLSAHHKLFNDMGINAVLTIGNVLSSNVINGNTTFNNQLISNNITAPSSTLAGTNNIYTNLIASGTIKIGNLLSTNVVEGDTTFSSDITTENIFCNTALYLNDYQPLPSPTTYSSILVQNSDILNFDANFNNNKFRFLVSSNAVLLLDATNTTIYNNLVANSQSIFNAGSRYYSTTNYTEFLQTGTQLTIKPVSSNGSLALFSSAPVSGTQTQQLLINNSGVSATTISSTNIFSTNYNTSSQIIDFGFNITTGTCNICASITTGNVNIGNTTAGSFKINIRGSLFSTGQATFQNFCPKSETDPSVANDLVKLSYLQNNFCDSSTTQIIGGEKTFTGNTIIGSALYFTDLDDTSSLHIPNINNYDKTLYFLANNNYDNRFEFWCALNPQLSISQYSTEIKNPLIANEEATFSKQATFNSFCPKTDTNPSAANDLVKLSYLQNNFCNLSTSQSIGGEKTFTDDLTAPNIFCNTALYFRDIDASIKKALIFHQADIVYFDTLTVFDNYWKFKCNGVEQLIISDLNTTIENKLKCNSELIHKETQIMNKVKTISTTSPAAFEFPLAERWMFTTTGSTQIAVTLPELTLSSQAGFNFSFFKTASITNSVLFTCQGTNKIRGLNSITDLTSDTRISGTGTTGGFYTAEVSTGNFVWISY